MADEEVPDALPPVGEALDAAFAVQRSALRRIEHSQRDLQASQREIAEVLTGHSELLLGIAEKVDKLSSG